MEGAGNAFVRSSVMHRAGQAAQFVEGDRAASVVEDMEDVEDDWRMIFPDPPSFNLLSAIDLEMVMEDMEDQVRGQSLL